MSEEKKGHVRISVDVEINEALMDLARESMAKIPEMMAALRKRRAEHEER